RVWAMSTLLRVVATHGRLARPESFELLLQMFDSTLTYRSLYPGRFEVPALLDLLVVDTSNPRGLYGVYSRLCKKLDEIAEAAGSTWRLPFAELMPGVDTLPTLERLCATDANGAYPELCDVCDQLGMYVAAASNEISARYFSHANTFVAQVSS
ncbi:MAG TPA: alpha-E domain-containing protein, partial [Trinickia sp.]|nr:alpha-E domain-containing protein [Trinickia sp.]